MDDRGISGVDEQVLARLDAVLDELAGLDLDSRSDDELLSFWRELESRRNRLAPVDHAILAQAEQRRLHQRYGASSLSTLTRGALRVGVGEARARVKAAQAAGPRRALTGESLAPRYEQVAAGQAEGSVSPAAARAITETIEALPEAVSADGKTWAEQFLTDQAGVFDLDSVRKLCTKVSDTLDPDGTLKDHEYRRANRDVSMTVRPDGSSRLRGEATAELTEHLRTLFDSLAAPHAEVQGAKDPRTAGQRRYDALVDAIARLERAEQLPDAGGVCATILLTMTAEAYTDAAREEPGEENVDAAATSAQSAGEAAGGESVADDAVADESAAAATGVPEGASTSRPARAGHRVYRAAGARGGYSLSGGRLARTGHGVLVPAREALRWAGGDARVVPIVFDRVRRVTAQGHAQRLFTESQRLAMAARDLGCSFPGCDAPPAWCQAHHVTDYVITRKTSIEDGTLLCGHHHREFERLGWQCLMIDGIPHWRPPWWIDTERRPMRNHAHDPIPTG